MKPGYRGVNFLVQSQSTLPAKLARLVNRLNSDDPRVRRAAEKDALFAARYGSSREAFLGKGPRA